MTTIVSRAATRLDLAGGSLDLWPLGMMVPGATTVNVAVSLAATVRCTRTGNQGIRFRSRDLDSDYTWREGDASGRLALLENLCRTFRVVDGWEIETSSDSPPGAGLGGSSALSLALALALGRIRGREEEPFRLVRICRDLEASLLGIPTGVQDFWPALRGGALCIRYLPGGEAIESLDVPLRDLAGRLVVCYTGQSRLSAAPNWELVKRCVERDTTALGALGRIADIARRLRTALLEGDLEETGRLVGREWAERVTLAEGIGTPFMERLSKAALEAGALGGKGCGAGGGGCMLFLVEEGARSGVRMALEKEGARVLLAYPVERGHSIEVEP